MMVGRFFFSRKNRWICCFQRSPCLKKKIAIDREFTKSPNFFVRNTKTVAMKTNSNVFNFCAYYGKFGTDNF